MHHAEAVGPVTGGAARQPQFHQIEDGVVNGTPDQHRDGHGNHQTNRQGGRLTEQQGIERSRKQDAAQFIEGSLDHSFAR